MVPVDRIKRAGVKKIKRRYSESCNMTRAVAMQEFDYFYRESRVTSVAVLAQTVGLSPHQFNRVLSGKGFPAQEVYAPARSKLIEMFGQPKIDLELVRSRKREMAVKVVLNATNLRKGSAAANAASEIHQIAPNIAFLATDVEPPSHNTMNDAVEYPAWVIRGAYGLHDVSTADGLGVFLTCREYLPGFVDNIIVNARLLASRDDELATQILVDINTISLILACFQVAQGRLRLVRRNLLTILSLPPQGRTSDRDFVGELVDRWSLDIAQFETADVTEGFLLMESPVCRARILQLLRDVRTTKEDI